MKQIEVFKKIGGIITELSEQYEYLKTVTEDLNELELELFAANAHFLTDHIEVLCKLNTQSQAERKNINKAEKTEKADNAEKPVKPVKFAAEPVHEPKYFEPVVQQMKFPSEKTDENNISEPAKSAEQEVTTAPEVVENVLSEKETEPVAHIEPEPEPEAEPTTTPEPEQVTPTAPETIRHELVIDESMLTDEDEDLEIEPRVEPRRRKTISITSEKIAAETPEVPQAAAFRPVEAEVVVTHIKEEVLTINQKISAQVGEKGISRTEQMGIKPISDLKLAITLNDKLLYVKDLFNGYNLAYSEAIEILNRFSTFEEAARFLKTNYVIKNNWDGKPATTEKFYALLKRRYA